MRAFDDKRAAGRRAWTRCADFFNDKGFTRRFSEPKICTCCGERVGKLALEVIQWVQIGRRFVVPEARSILVEDMGLQQKSDEAQAEVPSNF